ncbi:hypothetical protein SAMN04488096_108169 [Mesonia phycicola]|uniref:Outer membrane protein beta-barrel domain-containing protein n=1 Tax=Mesonia phycicola TaxID=579105 RepID=A0A1M6GR03_9FLAO|nr:hypothetical protein [Mesonia phycicola]SHJ12306.1 hypothetical protein SAMN04488096_108169 [Mesonia phycicola]
MKTIIISLTLFVATALGYTATAQLIQLSTTDNLSLKVEDLQKQKTKVEEVEKGKLKEEIEKINQRLEDNEITAIEAAELKKKAAEKRALNIENQLDIIDANIALLKRNARKLEGEDKESVEYYYTSLQFLDYDEKKKVDYDSIPKRTTSDLFFALGLNNAMIEGQSLDDSPYKIGGSRFFEIGYEFETVLVKSGFVRVKYGLAFQFNGLKADDNMYFVDNGEETILEEFPFSLNKAKLRMDNLVIPIHFELGPSKLKYGKNKAYYDKSNFKIGLGGYVGLNLNTIQKIKYEENGKSRKDKLSQSYNTNNFIYGLSAYVGYNNIGLYIKYDVNTIFKDNTIDQNNISLGVRVGI